MPAVTRVTQSPMNALRWVLDLACGHETAEQYTAMLREDLGRAAEALAFLATYELAD